jgi:glycosyltransferase involved in cell wall biosynthesis
MTTKASRFSLAIYLPDLGGGGVERMRVNLAHAFIQRGIDVTFVLHQARGQNLALLPPAARVISLEASRTLAALPGLVRFLRAHRPDVLLSSLGHNNVLALCARDLARVQTRVVVCQHNALSRESKAFARWQYRILPQLYRLLLPRADAVVAVSKGVADDMSRAARLARERISVIYNPVVSPAFEVGPDGHGAPHPWFDNPATPVFVGMGRLVPQKDFPTLIRAFAALDRSLDARLMILGDGPLRAELAALAEELGVGPRVELTGFKSDPLPYLRRAAALVMSSSYEGFGNVLVEGMACGTPVISTDCPYGPAEILDNGAFGPLVPVGDAPALARAMGDVLTSRPSPDRLRARAAEFTVAPIAEQYLDVFSAVSPQVASWRAAAGGGHQQAASPPRLAPPPRVAAPGRVRSAAIYVPQLLTGGAEMAMTCLAQGLGRRGIDVHLLVHDHIGLPEAQRAAPLAVVNLDVTRSTMAVPGLVRFLRRRRPDVLVAALSHNNIVAVLAHGLAGGRASLVLTEHAPVSAQMQLKKGIRYRALPALLPSTYSRADAIVAVSQGVREDLRGLLRGRAPRIEVIHNPVLTADWQELSHAPVDDAWFAPGAPPVVLSVARLSAEKDLGTLVRAFARVLTFHPSARLAILGDGPERQDLQSLVSALGLDREVRLMGWVTNPLPYMRRARVFVLASLFEGFGNALVEAMACGAQVISTDCPFGPAEILDNGRYGRLVPVRDVEALATAISGVLQGDAPRPGAEERALEYTAERSIDRYLTLFEETHDSRAARLAKSA